MAAFRRDYLASRTNEALVIVDVGSQDLNGSYRPLFAQPPWRYIGVDVTQAANVEVILHDPYNWVELEEGSADVIIAGQTFEHTEYVWESMRQIARTLKPGGLTCIIVPSAGHEHRFPVDCWRIYPDGLRALARFANLEVLEAWTQWEDLPQYDNESNKWHDSVLVARKPVA